MAKRSYRVVHMEELEESPSREGTAAGGGRRIRRSPTGYYPDLKAQQTAITTPPSTSLGYSAGNSLSRTSTSSDNFVSGAARRTHKALPPQDGPFNSSKQKKLSRLQKLFHWVQNLRVVRYKRYPVHTMHVRMPQQPALVTVTLERSNSRSALSTSRSCSSESFCTRKGDSDPANHQQLKKRHSPVNVLTLVRKLVRIRLIASKSSKMSKSPSHKMLKATGVPVQRWV